jgi:hypothetical protein
MEKLKIVPEDFNWFTKLPEYLTWSSASSSALLWYAGQPRSGKTTLLQALVVKLLDRQWRNREIDVVYFFCPESTSAEEATFESHILPATILRSLIGQLLSRDHHRIAELELESYLLRDVDTRAEKLWELLELVIKAATGQEMYIIIDGVDKIKAVDQLKAEDLPNFLKGLLKLWRTLQSKAGPVAKFLITSRPYTEIRDFLKGVPVIDENTERMRKYFELLPSILFTDKTNGKRLPQFFIFQ